jgi:hypothetical protein
MGGWSRQANPARSRLNCLEVAPITSIQASVVHSQKTVPLRAQDHSTTAIASLALLR